MKFSAAVLLSLTTLSMPATIEAVARNTKHDSMSMTNAPGFVSSNSRKSPKQNRMTMMSSKKTASPTITPTANPTACLQVFMNEIDNFGDQKYYEFVIANPQPLPASEAEGSAEANALCRQYKLEFFEPSGINPSGRVTYTTRDLIFGDLDDGVVFCNFRCGFRNELGNTLGGCNNFLSSYVGGARIVSALTNEVIHSVSWGQGDPLISGATYIGDTPRLIGRANSLSLMGNGCCYAEFDWMVTEDRGGDNSDSRTISRVNQLTGNGPEQVISCSSP